MRLALCNEVLATMPPEQQCAYAAALGYDGLEIAPCTLSETPDRLRPDESSRIRTVVEKTGPVVTGLHWLLAKPAALWLTDPDRWLPTGLVAHPQINDPNRRAPGQSALPFAPVAAAHAWHGYAGTVAVELFDDVPEGAGAAVFAAGYWRGVRATLA